MTAPVKLERWRGDSRARIARGKKKPGPIAWFGFSAFWGHLRHMVASVIATENIDSRQWMIPEAPDVLLDRVKDVLGSKSRDAETLAEAMGGEIWIDFVADTGDDVTASEAVARMIARPYEVDDLVLPRGDVLFHGGDLAYPVATVLEITRRLVEPWNKVFHETSDGRARVLLAVPGNHDWYDGLDGFARLCQSPCAFEEQAALSQDPHHPRPSLHPVLAWAEAFARGDQVAKPKALALTGYVPVQRTSYFRLPLAPGIDLFAVDRQLKRLDDRQAAYFAVPGAPARLLVVPDPARAWGEKRPHGVATLDALGIDAATSPTLVLAGDIHHYERSREGRSVHVVAGGGGAFLHAARVAGGAEYAVEAEFPGRRASLAILGGLPFHCATGRAGWLLLTVFAAFDAIALAEYFRDGVETSSVIALLISLVVAIGTALLVGWRRHRAARVVPFAAVLGLGIGVLPVALGVIADALALRVIGGGWGGAGRPFAFVCALTVATFASGFLFGAMLMIIARLGLNHAQAYAALGSAGYRHFVRLRVRGAPGESRVDAWVVGAVDPVGDATPVLVDTFGWSPYEER
jgi:hypothetical protein